MPRGHRGRVRLLFVAMLPSVGTMITLVFIPKLFVVTLARGVVGTARGATLLRKHTVSETFETIAILAGIIALVVATVTMGIIAARSNRD